MLIGTFTKLDVFTGTFRTVHVAATLSIVPVDKVSDNAPDYRVSGEKPHNLPL